MTTIFRRRAALLAIPLMLAACSQPVAGPQAIDPEAVAVSSALGQIKGHHIASLELLRSGDQTFSITHASHPVAEIIDSIRSDLQAASAPTAQLEAALGDVVAAAQAGSVDELEAAIEASRELVGQAEQAVGGSAAATSAYRASVIADLLATAAHEYEEALSDGEIANVIEYQDAYAFTQQALADYGALKAEVQTAAPDEAAEIDAAFASLTAALPGVDPPATLAEHADVEAAAALIGHELEEVLGALAVIEADPAEQQAEIEQLLDEIVDRVGAGDREQAAELAAEAYLDHYELIEADVIAAAPEINAELEPLLGAGLRQLINGGATAEEIETSIERVRQLLADAVEAVEAREHE